MSLSRAWPKKTRWNQVLAGFLLCAPARPAHQPSLLGCWFCRYISGVAAWWGGKRHNRLVFLAMCHGLNAFRQFQVGDVQRRTLDSLAQVDLNVLWQVGGQALNLQLGHHMVNHGPVELHCRRSFAVDEVQRHLFV